MPTKSFNFKGFSSSFFRCWHKNDIVKFRENCGIGLYHQHLPLEVLWHIFLQYTATFSSKKQTSAFPPPQEVWICSYTTPVNSPNRPAVMNTLYSAQYVLCNVYYSLLITQSFFLRAKCRIGGLMWLNLYFFNHPLKIYWDPLRVLDDNILYNNIRYLYFLDGAISFMQPAYFSI